MSKIDLEIYLRHSTGKAVMATATPTKSIKCPQLTSSSTNCLNNATAKSAPKPNGRIIPAAEMVREYLAFRFNTLTSTSIPTRKRNKTRPMVDVKVNNGSESGGKIFAENPGIRPMIVGPRIIPPITSAMTRG